MTTDQPPPTPGEPAGTTPGGRIIVGVDGSSGSLTALRWAIEEARAHGRTVHAVTAWNFPESGYGYSYGAGWMQAPEQAADSLATAAEKMLEAAVDQTAPATSDPGHPVTITRTVVEGHAAQVLLGQAQQADLLVVGSRGHGGFVGLLLGSVGQHLVTHAHCPTVVVPTPDHH
jgi:nucleotide-binding universal stress UspA family protein